MCEANKALYFFLTSMGGAFTDRLSWRWCFYINLPFGAVTVVFIGLFLQPSSSKTADRPSSVWAQIQLLDVRSTFLFIPSIVSLLLALQWGGSVYPWKDGRIIGLLLVFCVLLLAFVFLQWRLKEAATVPPRLFLNQHVYSCSLFAAFLGAAFFVTVYYVSSTPLAVNDQRSNIPGATL